ncbi:hypothetical protein [Scytonema sp. HK-05]|uniref:hypothetical protein n=1 Tax=Scytonema sp. HK-05 TaxID=1137095 RepID=UPI0011612B49|nr:hypothetical protein [Scytonema sp. HK-05]
MLSPDEHKPVVNLVGDRLHITQIFDCPASFYRYLYCEVGRDYYYRGLSSSTHQLPKTGI